MWEMVVETTRLGPVTIKTFPVLGMLPDNGATLRVTVPDEPWAKRVRARIRPGPVDHITTGTNR